MAHNCPEGLCGCKYSITRCEKPSDSPRWEVQRQPDLMPSLLALLEDEPSRSASYVLDEEQEVFVDLRYWKPQHFNFDAPHVHLAPEPEGNNNDSARYESAFHTSQTTSRPAMAADFGVVEQHANGKQRRVIKHGKRRKSRKK